MLRSFLFVALAVAVFSVPALLIPPDSMTEILSAGLLIACGFGIYRWGAAAFRGIRDGARTKESWGILAIVLLLGAMAAQRIYSVVYLNLDRPVWMQQLHISPFIVYVMLIAVVLFSASTTFPGERPTRMGGVAAAVIAFVGVLGSHLGPLALSKLGWVWNSLSSLLSRLFPL